MDDHKVSRGIRGSYRVLILICTLIVVVSIASLYFFDKDDENLTIISEEVIDPDEIKDGIHIRTGFVEAPGMKETITNCTTCHSSQLVIQNRMNKQAWEATIDWMQETQNLWPLGDNEAIIIEYLVKNYPPVKKGRRAILKTSEWYELPE